MSEEKPFENIPGVKYPEQSSASASIVPVEGGNLELSAQSPDEIVQCHSTMIEWCKRKIVVISGEARELRESADHAKKSKWKFATLERHAGLAQKRVVFYQKMLGALEAGYHIIPPMKVELFAIRTTKEYPNRDWGLYRWAGNHNYEQPAQILDQGEGEYKNPHPVVLKGAEHKDDQGGKVHEFWAENWDDLEFPANMARVHVMEATNRAMALKVFDELGMLPADRKRNPDPMIVGRIHDYHCPYGFHKTVHFLIAWHIDTRSL